MGLSDRDYYQPQRPGATLRGPGTIVGWIILINVVIFLADGLFTGPPAPKVASDPVTGQMRIVEADTHPVSDNLALHMSDVAKPWLWWRTLTYGFTHASWPYWQHIVFNMLGLFFLGRAVEMRYGQREFLRLYLAFIVFGGAAWAISNQLMGVQGGAVVGASGAVVGIVVLFALNYPRQTLLIWGILPVPAWLVGVLIVVSDLFGAAGTSGTASDHPVAYGVHLAGAAFALLYFRGRWNLTQWTDRWLSFAWLKSGPKLKVHDPDSTRPKSRGPDMSQEVDRILEKIHREGESSLTRKERRTMETASRQYQQKHGTRDD